MGKSSKADKEAFVSNLNGGTVLEVNEITLVAAVSILQFGVEIEGIILLISCK